MAELVVTVLQEGPQGIQGPVGPAGPAGAAGAPGAPGANGLDGSRISVLTSPPDNTVGKDGDMAVVKPAGNYYTKAAGVWTLQGSIVGPQGPQGVSGVGSLWHSGSGAPSNTLGNDNDFYLNTANGNYHFKSAGAWALRGNLIGPTGPAGPTGATGPQGPQGVKGDPGIRGLTWRGAWASTTAYVANDGVSHQGQSWIALRASTGVAPVAGADWGLLAAKGLDGDATPPSALFNLSIGAVREKRVSVLASTTLLTALNVSGGNIYVIDLDTNWTTSLAATLPTDEIANLTLIVKQRGNFVFKLSNATLPTMPSAASSVSFLSFTLVDGTWYNTGVRHFIPEALLPFPTGEIMRLDFTELTGLAQDKAGTNHMAVMKGTWMLNAAGTSGVAFDFTPSLSDSARTNGIPGWNPQADWTLVGVWENLHLVSTAGALLGVTIPSNDDNYIYIKGGGTVGQLTIRNRNDFINTDAPTASNLVIPNNFLTMMALRWEAATATLVLTNIHNGQNLSFTTTNIGLGTGEGWIGAGAIVRYTNASLNYSDLPIVWAQLFNRRLTDTQLRENYNAARQRITKKYDNGQTLPALV